MNMKKLSFVIIFCLLFSYQVSGVCAQGLENAFSIESGSLDYAVDPITSINTDNSSWTIASNDGVTFEKTDKITVSDLSGTNQGWKFNINFTTFTNMTNIDDPTVKDANLHVYINVADWLSLDICDDAGGLLELKENGSPLSAVNGTDIMSENYTANSDVTGAGSSCFLQVEPGFGAGVFDFYLMYRISVNDWLPTGTKIESSTNTGKFANISPVIVDNDVQKYQIFAGTYQTTITYSISGNPEI